MTPAEVIKRFFELLKANDYAGIAELLDPEVVWLGTSGGLDARRVVEGTQGFIDYLKEIDAVWEELDVEVEELIESGETVVAFTRERGRARGGIDVENATAAVFKVRNGQIVETQGYLDRDEALEAAQLRR